MKVLGSEAVDVSYHPWISQIEESVINDESVWSGGVERGKISVSGNVAIEVGMREGSSVKGCPVDGGILCSSSL